jgi:DNA-binding CsgD family transcriptional regulator
VNKREREVIHRTAIGERLSEIAKALSIPEGTATNTLRTVRIALKKRRSRGR